MQILNNRLTCRFFATARAHAAAIEARRADPATRPAAAILADLEQALDHSLRGEG